jgi:hypothetical protein
MALDRRENPIGGGGAQQGGVPLSLFVIGIVSDMRADFTVCQVSARWCHWARRGASNVALNR